MTDFYIDRGMRESIIFFDHNSFHMYTRVGVGRDGTELKSNINFVLKMVKYAMDVKLVMGLRMGISGYVLCNIKVVGAWLGRKEKRKEVGKN